MYTTQLRKRETPPNPDPVGSLFKPPPPPPEIVETDTGITLSDNVTFEQWAEKVTEIQRSHKCMMWWLGDLYIHGEKFGEEASQFWDAYARDTINKSVRLCRVFPHSRRRAELGPAYHMVVISLPEHEQDKLLDAAIAGDWSRDAMRARAQERMAELGLGRHKRSHNHPPGLVDDDDDDQPEQRSDLWLSNLREIPLVDMPATPKNLPDAVELLEAIGAKLPEPLERATALLLEDRERLYRIAVSVKRSMSMGFAVSPNCVRLLNEVPYPLLA